MMRKSDIVLCYVTLQNILHLHHTSGAIIDGQNHNNFIFFFMTQSSKYAWELYIEVPCIVVLHRHVKDPYGSFKKERDIVSFTLSSLSKTYGLYGPKVQPNHFVMRWHIQNQLPPLFPYDMLVFLLSAVWC